MPLQELTIAQLKTRVRTIIWLLLACVVCISTWSIVTERRDVIATAERKTEGYARALAEHSESAFAESDRALRDVLHDISTAGGSESIDRLELFNILRRQTLDAPQIGAMFLVNASGSMFINSSQFPYPPINVADRDYFRYYQSTPDADLSISRPVMSRLVQRWRFNLMRPLAAPGRPFSGLAAVAFEVEYFRRFFSAASMGHGGRIALLRTDGTPLVFEPYIEGVYQRNFNSTLLFREKLPAANAGTFHVGADHNPLDKGPRILSYQRLSRFPVVAVVSVDMEEVLAPWARKAIMQAGLIIGLCMSVVLLMRLLVRHLDRLQNAQQALQEQQEQLRIKAVQTEAAHDAILLLDTEGCLVQVNQALCQMTGYPQEELLGNPLRNFEPPEFAARIAQNIQMLLEKGEATFESAYLTKQGSVLPVEVSARLLTSQDQPFVLSIVRDISERKRSERRETTKSRILEELATGTNLPDLLQHIVSFVEQEREGALCSVLLLDEGGGHLRHGAAPSLPDEYNRAVDGLRIARGMGSCGTAAFTRKRVIVEDIETHPYWKGFKPARVAGLRACWSEPVISAEGELLGTFAIYHREPRSPDTFEIQLIESAAHLASIAIDRFQAEKRRKQLESQLHHVQKIDAIGQLAGGIAHDFNNLLTPIIVYAEMIQRKLPEDDPLARKTQGIMNAAAKARDLTRQLLSFGRKQVLNLQPVDLNEVIASFHDMLRRTIRENIAIYSQPAPGGVKVQADRGQLEQILLNLAVNAQDAISGNGSIVIETGHVVLDNEFVRLHPGLMPGPYALLAFIDSGCGMDDDTLGHIFEPFFTTKQVGHGTGLGLSTVYGIVKQHEGYITVNSRVGEGTTFNIFLPLSKQAVMTPDAPPEPDMTALTPGPEGTILVVEDNEMVRAMTVELLESSGYRVLVAELPSVAQDLARKHGQDIDLLVTDVIMPEANGHELYERLRESLPGLRVLYMSGYTNEVFVHNGTLEEGINFLQKPFTAERFLYRIRETLVQAPPS